MEKTELIEKAKEARKLSYAPYSKFNVGAAVLTKNGKVFFGTNIENASYSLCMCAERNALYQCYLNGYKKEDITALAVVADTDEPVAPCGACRQVMEELMPDDAKVYMANLKGQIKEVTVEALLPFAFSKKDLD